MRRYAYIGPIDLLELVQAEPTGCRITRPEEARDFVVERGLEADQTGAHPVTFVVDVAGRLLVAERHSEHVVCAGGAAVLAAGELWFEVTGGRAEVVEVSNQSTGYCPEPSCWAAVEAALEAARLEHPGGLTRACVFRRCPSCGMRNLVKDAVYVCAVCDAALPEAWNF